jgi:signal transduction histidine kinase
MKPTKVPLPSEREQTDESLRHERDRTDRALEEDAAIANDMADEVVARARDRADALLRAARRATDAAASGSASTVALESARHLADRTLGRERVAADAALLDERTQQASILARERESTDHDLSRERAGADAAVAARDEFLAIVSHDLRDLLNAVMGGAALIVAEAPGHAPERVMAHAQRIQRAVSRMGRLVGDLVDVASIEAGTLAVTRAVADPAAVVAEAIDTYQGQATARGIALRAEIAAGLPPVAFDAARILQVLCNLVGNAIKFTPAGGAIVVRAEPADGGIALAVSDTGPGLPDDKLEAVFDRFLQLTKGDGRGVGLGLFIARCIVQGHGGRIWAENRVGGGSVFSLMLPGAAGMDAS